MILRHSVALLLVALALCFSPGAQAAIPGAQSLYSCLGIFGLGKAAERSCIYDSDCPAQHFCSENQCTMAMNIAQPEKTAPPAAPFPPPDDSFVDDGGADAVCGTNRRCRIQRMASQNRQRRHLQIAEQELETQAQINRLLQRKKESINRLNRPWAAAFQVHPLGYGILASRAINAHFHAEVSTVWHNKYVYFFSDDPQLPSIDGYSQGVFGIGHLTFLPSKSWFSPLFSAGFGLGRGSFESYSYSSSGTISTTSPTTTYHLVTAAVGADAQLKSGFLLRLAFRHGRILYNQARYSPGIYDLGLRNALRDYMNSEELWGVDFSIGWAF